MKLNPSGSTKEALIQKFPQIMQGKEHSNVQRKVLFTLPQCSGDKDQGSYQWSWVSSLFYNKAPDDSLRHSKEKCQAMGRNSMSVIQVQVMMMMIKKKMPRCFPVYITPSHKDIIILHFISLRIKAQREKLAIPRSWR